MARPSKLTTEQWDEIAKRLLAGKDSASDLAREYGVNRSAITRKHSHHIATVKKVANQIVDADVALRSLPVAQQITTIEYAAQLKSIGEHLGEAARYGAMTAHRLLGIANDKAAKIDEETDFGTEEAIDSLKIIGALTKVGRESADIGLNLLKSNRPESGDQQSQTAAMLAEIIASRPS